MHEAETLAELAGAHHMDLGASCRVAELVHVHTPAMRVDNGREADVPRYSHSRGGILASRGAGNPGKMPASGTGPGSGDGLATATDGMVGYRLSRDGGGLGGAGCRRMLPGTR